MSNRISAQARDYMRANPGVKYTEAVRAVTTSIDVSIPVMVRLGTSPVGRDVFAQLFDDNGAARHLQVGGRTGAGKTVLVHTIAYQLVNSPNVDVRIIEDRYGNYSDLPHGDAPDGDFDDKRCRVVIADDVVDDADERVELLMDLLQPTAPQQVCVILVTYGETRLSKLAQNRCWNRVWMHGPDDLGRRGGGGLITPEPSMEPFTLLDPVMPPPFTPR